MKRKKNLLRKLEKIPLQNTYSRVYFKVENIYYVCTLRFIPVILGYFLDKEVKAQIPLFPTSIVKEGLIFELDYDKMKYKITEIIKTNKYGVKDFTETITTLVKETDKIATIVSGYLILGKEITCPKENYQVIETEDKFILICQKGKGYIVGDYNTIEDAKKSIMLEELQ